MLTNFCWKSKSSKTRISQNNYGIAAMADRASFIGFLLEPVIITAYYNIFFICLKLVVPYFVRTEFSVLTKYRI